MERAPKWWRHFRAWIGRYYWMPCKICGEMHGGHELHGSIPVKFTSASDGMQFHHICVLCAVERQEKADEALMSGRYPLKVWNGRTTHEFPFSES